MKIDFSTVMIQNKSTCERLYLHAHKRTAKILFAVTWDSKNNLDVYSEVEVNELKVHLQRVLNQLNQQKPIILLNHGTA